MTTTPLTRQSTDAITAQNTLAVLAFRDGFQNVPLNLLLSGFYAEPFSILPGGAAYERLGRKHSQTVRYLSATRENSYRVPSKLWSDFEGTTRQTSFMLTSAGQRQFDANLPRVQHEQGVARVLNDAPILGRVKTLSAAQERFNIKTKDLGALDVQRFTRTKGALFAASITHQNPKHAWLTGGVLSSLGENLSTTIKTDALCRALRYKNERSLPSFLRSVQSQGILRFESEDAGVTAHLTLEARTVFAGWHRQCEALAVRDATEKPSVSMPA